MAWRSKPCETMQTFMRFPLNIRLAVIVQQLKKMLLKKKWDQSDKTDAPAPSLL